MGGKANRTKGHNFERYLVKVLSELFNRDCVTSRSESKRQDDAGNDIVGCPVYVQAKATKVTPNFKRILNDMYNKLGKDKPSIVIHKRSIGKGHKLEESDTLVVMSLEDFKKIVKL